MTQADIDRLLASVDEVIAFDGKFTGLRTHGTVERKMTSRDEIKQLMDPDFNLLKTSDVPLLIREHERKYQYIVSHMMVFQRKEIS